MRRKLFIAVKLDAKSQTYLQQKILKIKKDLFAKWIPPENYHLTLEYLGYVDDENLMEIITRLQSALNRQTAFDFTLKKITGSPSLEKPRMLWAIGEKSRPLAVLKNLIGKSLFTGNFNNVSNKTSFFLPHITLARLNKYQQLSLPKEKFPLEIERLLIPVNAVQLMESKQEGRKVRYYLMESFEFY